MRPGETYPQVIETRFGFHIVKLMEKDAGGQKDLSEPRVQTQVRQAIFNRKDQTLKNAFSEAARNKATVVNYLAAFAKHGKKFAHAPARPLWLARVARTGF